MEYLDHFDDVVESIFSSYFDFTVRHPNKKFGEWSKNKNARKKFKTLKLILEQKGNCYHCKGKLLYKTGCKHPLKTSLDRVIPGSKGGGYNIENIVLSCNQCNKQRGDKSIEEFHAWQQSSS